MATILKQILLKDITRFIYIYIFILISFGYAIHAIMQADYHLDPDYRSPTSTIYLTFYRMLSPEAILDVSVSEDYKRSGGSVAVLRAICSVYSILSTVVLMNMLIAMMNSTYSDVSSMKSAAWRLESLRMALWLERHFPLRKLKFLTLKGTINDSSQNRWYMKYNPEDRREVWGGVEEMGEDSDNDENPDEEDEDGRSQKSITMADLNEKISELQRQLAEKKDSENELQQCMLDLKKQMQAIHELCRESSQLARITRPEVSK